MEYFSDYIIDLAILRQNVSNIKRIIGNNVKFCAVVKANAYGMGVESVCRAISDNVDFFAVANVNEAMEIRSFNKESKILVLGNVSVDNFEKCSNNNISVSISRIDQLENIPHLKTNLNIHLQVNSGLNRFGFRSLIEFKKALQIIDSNPYLTLEGVYSHFATKGNDVVFIKKQMYRFLQFKKVVKSDIVFHIANSFALTHFSKFRLNMVRSGFLMYGEMNNDIGNKPILSIKSRLVNILNVKKGDTIGYDRTFLVKKNTKIGVVPIGYADGFDRRLSNNFKVLIGGKYCSVVGLVCMDVFMVDLTDCEANLYDEVVILGCQKGKQITLQDYADALSTSPYEILLKFKYNRMNYIVKQ